MTETLAYAEPLTADLGKASSSVLVNDDAKIESIHSVSWY
jgi:hypothetical protein